MSKPQQPKDTQAPIRPPQVPGEHEKRGNGRYCEPIAREICDRLAKGETLLQMSRDQHMPAHPTVLDWARDKRTPEIWTGEEASSALSFADRYARARQVGYEVMAEQLIDIVDDSSNDWVEREAASGRMQRMPDHEHVNRSKLRADARKWLLAKALPATYGDKVAHEHSGPEGGPIRLGLDEFVNKLNAIAARASADEGDDTG